MTIEELYSAACKGDYKTIKSYFDDKKTAELNRRYISPFGEVSLIMAAYRNRMYDICTYLIYAGETITDKEFEEIKSQTFNAIATVQIYQHMNNLKNDNM